jgi:hypothetical protein
MSVVEGQDFGGEMIQGDAAPTIAMEQIEPLEDGQAEIYERAFQGFHEARNNLQSLLVAGGFGNKDIIKAEFQGDNKHFVTRPSANGING